jgi:hypothetical protein
MRISGGGPPSSLVALKIRGEGMIYLKGMHDSPITSYDEVGTWEPV